MSAENKSMDTVVSDLPSVTRVGGYDHTNWIGWYKVHGLSFNHTETTYDVGSGHSFWSSKEGVVGTLIGTTSGHGTYNDCDHTKTEWFNPRRPVYSRHTATYNGRPVEIVSTGLSAAPSDLLNWLLAHGEASLSYGDSDLNARNRVLSELEIGAQSAGINLPTFLGELRDFREISQRVSKQFRAKPGQAPSLRTAFKRWGDKASLGEFVRMAVSADLMNKFAIQPFLRDLRQLSTLGQHLSTQVDRLRNGKPVAVRSATTDSSSKLSFEHNASNGYYYHECSSSVEGQRKVNVSVYVTFDRTEIQNSKHLLALDALGFNRPIETIWELVPYSFVVDYFIGIGDFLSQFRGQFLDIPYTVQSQGYSIKKVITAEVEARFDTGIYTSNWNNDAPSSSATGRAVRTIYSRKGGLPTWSVALPQIRLPSISQLGTIGELIYMRSS
jgi:hypothetical protein